MRALDFISEIETLDAMSGSSWIPDRSLRGLKPIPGKTELYYKVEKKSQDSGPTVLLYDRTITKPRPTKARYELDKEYKVRVANWEKNKTGKVIGSLQTMGAGAFPIKNAVRVGTIAIDPAYQGLGLGQFMYDVIVNELKLPLLAGSSQTPDGQRAWLQMAKNPNINVVGYYSISDELITKRPGLIDKIMKLGGQPLGRPFKTKYDKYYFFVFPVKFGRGRLSPVVLNKLSQIYSDDEFGTGLYAVGARR